MDKNSFDDNLPLNFMEKFNFSYKEHKHNALYIIKYFGCLKRGVRLILNIETFISQMVTKIETVWKEASSFQPLVAESEALEKRLLSQMQEQQQCFEQVTTLLTSLQQVGYDRNQIDRNALVLNSVEEKVMLFLPRFKHILNIKATLDLTPLLVEMRRETQRLAPCTEHFS